MPAETQLAQRAFRFALDPTPRQARMFASHAGGARFAYNWGNARIIAALDAWQAEKEALAPEAEEAEHAKADLEAAKLRYAEMTHPQRRFTPRDELEAQAALENAERAAAEAAAHATPSTEIPNHFALCKTWTAWKNEHATDPEPAEGERRTNTAWVTENFVGTYQAALRDVAKAWSDFFASRSGKRKGRRLGRPRFKKKGKSKDSFQVHGGTLRMESPTHVTLPKIGTVTVMSDDSLHPAVRRSRNRATRPAPRHLGNRRRARTLWRAIQRGGDARLIRGTVTRGADGLWWLSLTAEVPVQARAVPSRAQREGGLVGADFGVREVATLSNGARIPNPRYLEASLAELRTAQKAFSRCQPGSRRREKARARVGLIHADVARLREAALHRATTALVRQHDVIAVEGWNVQQLMQHGSAKVPRRIRRDRNRALADTGLGAARQMLAYKGPQVAATVLVTSPQAPTGRTCSVDRKVRTTPLPPHQEMFTSDQCGHVLDRPLNTAQAVAGWAAQELRKHGPSISGPAKPRGGDVRPSAGRKAGGGRSPVKRAASARRSRGEAGTPSG